MSNNNSPCKTLIIGSGIGGLNMGIILAGLGFEVTIIEKNSRVGGLIRSCTRDGIECEVGVHYLGSLDQGQILHKFFHYLGVSEDIPVTRMGENRIIDPIFLIPEPNGNGALICRRDWMPMRKTSGGPFPENKKISP